VNLWSEKKARQCTDGNIKDQVQKALGKTPLFSERITVIIFTLNERVKKTMVIFVFYRILLLFFFSFQDCNQKHEKIKNKIRNKILPRFVSRHS
jgi:hypothetical protein